MHLLVAVLAVIQMVALAVAGTVVVSRRRATARAARRGWLDERIRARVIVHTSDDQSYDGVLSMVSPDGLVLAAPRLAGDDLVLAGDVFIPEAKVVMVQVTPR